MTKSGKVENFNTVYGKIQITKITDSNSVKEGGRRLYIDMSCLVIRPMRVLRVIVFNLDGG